MNMRRLFLFLIILVSFVSSGCNQRQNPQSQKYLVSSQAVSDSDTWDFGQVRQGAILKHDFIFKNESKKVLKIQEITTSCGCTVSKVIKKTLLPDEATLIEVTFDSRDYAGSVQQYIYVHTDNLDKPVIRYIIKANVVL